MKKLYFFIIFMIFSAVCAFCADYPKPESWINDYAGVLNSNQKQELDSILKEFENKTKDSQILVCIMNKIPVNTTLEEYVNELFSRWNPGQKEKDNGVLLAIFIQDRKMRIEVGYGLEDKLTDALSKMIIANDITPEFKQGNYHLGIKNGITHMIQAVAGYEPVSKPNSLKSSADNEGGLFEIFFIILVIIIVLYMSKKGWITALPISTSNRRRSKKWDNDFGYGGWTSSTNSRSSSSSGKSSGGFFSGGGGFSGGKGGFSGGGGASGSW